MLPSRLIPLSQLPLTPNGKIDVSRLPAPSNELSNYDSDAPKTLYETKVAEIWTKLLGIEDIGLQHDFFEIGGSSIKLIELIVCLQNEFSIRISVNQLFQHSTLSGMAMSVENVITGKEKGAHPYIMYNPNGNRVIHCFPPAGGYGLVYRSLADQMPDYTLVSFNYVLECDKIKHYADVIQTQGDNGSYTLFGYSLGGNMAFEVGKELERRGLEGSDVIIMDSYRILEPFDFNENDLKLFEKELSKHLMKHMGSGVVHQHTLQQAKDYISFFGQNLNKGTVKALVSVIVEENSKGFYQAGQRKVTKEDSWRGCSQRGTRVYTGNGEHADMLDEVFVGRNAEIIRQITTRVATRKGVKHMGV